MKTKFKISKLLFLISICSVCLCCNKIKGQEKPNIIIMMADDLGYGDVGYMGHQFIETPNIDELANKGVQFTQFYAGHPTCSPSRAGMMAGRTPFRNGVYTYIPGNSCVHLRDEQVTLAEICKKQGYDTGFFGKWGLIGDMEDKSQPSPNDQGFDYWLATHNNAAPSHKNPTNFYRNGKAEGEIKGYSSQIVVDNAMEWLNSRKDKSKPFLLVLWFHEPHRKLAQPESFTKKYEKHGEIAGEYYANINHMDFQIGRMMNYLNDNKLTDKSWITFTSDNGPKDLAGRSTNGLRGRKGSLYEGGYKVPTAMYWKGKLEGGKTINEPLVFFDFVPTFYDLFGMKPMSQDPLDGVSMLPVIEGEKLNREDPPVWMAVKHMAIRNGDWKVYAYFEDYTPGTSFQSYLKTRKIEKYELYNLIDDPNEIKNLVKQNTETFEMMKQLVNKRRMNVQEDMKRWEGSGILPYEVATWFNENIPPGKVFKKLPAKEQDLLKSAE
ncbi:sulfatase family protein [Mariniflexile sp.]|uniref:sulfatase family protein n=1 Tax=Mariniflexile sp. TaxID=1979402 RepID=UPI004047B9C0